LSVGFWRRKTLEWLSKFGKLLTPLEEETYDFGSNDAKINCYQPGHIKKNCKNLTVGWIDYVQKFKEEHDFSDELLGNWILGLN
jgi:hypothetical protein